MVNILKSLQLTTEIIQSFILFELFKIHRITIENIQIFILKK